jgi:hypothetical protein
MKHYLTGVFFYELYPGKPFLHDLGLDEGQTGCQQMIWDQPRGQLGSRQMIWDQPRGQTGCQQLIWDRMRVRRAASK